MEKGKVLTHREKVVLIYLCADLTYSQIAGRLDISYHTVKFHVSNIYEKIGVHDKIQAYRWFFANQNELFGGTLYPRSADKKR